ncbi:MAG: histidine phosphatase family protein [Rickettsiales bacterium]|jgi:probable phosphoglycerate mutase|nr:histidine phosphatase family protein [Rickettsiales bacterium]
MSRTDFYIFRHGETDWNAERRIQGQTRDIPLNARGVAQAKELAENMKYIPLDVIYSSPLGRALETAKIVAKTKIIPVVGFDELKEHHYGTAEGKLHSEITPAELSACYNVERDFCFPGGETHFASAARAKNALLLIAESTDAEHIGIASHRGLIKCLLVHIFGIAGGYEIPHAVPLHVICDKGNLAMDKACAGYRALSGQR